MTSEPTDGARSRGARASLRSPREPRSYRVTIRLSACEHARLLERAAAAGLSLSQCLRATDPKIPPPRRNLPPVAHQILAELRRLGNNVNQAIRLCHQGRIPEQLHPLFAETLAALASFQAALVGELSQGQGS